MLSVYGSSTNKSLKLNINTSATLEQPSTKTKVVQQLGSFNPKLSISSNTSAPISTNLNKRLCTLDDEEEEPQVNKKQIVSMDNVNMLSKYNKAPEETPIKKEFEEDKNEIKYKVISPAESQLDASCLDQFKIPRRKMISSAFLQRRRPQIGAYGLMPTGGRPAAIYKAPNFPRTNFKYLPPRHPGFAYGMNNMMANPKVQAMHMYRQLIQLELALLGGNFDSSNKMYGDLQMIHKLKQECLINQNKPFLPPRGLAKPFMAIPRVPQHMVHPKRMLKKVEPQVAPQTAEKPTPVANETMTLGSGFISFQSSKILQQHAQEHKTQGTSPVEVKPVSSSSQFTINFTHKGSTTNLSGSPKSDKIEEETRESSKASSPM